MTKENSSTDQLSAYNEFGDAFDQDEDPLKKFSSKFNNIDKNPIDIYKQTKVENSGLSESRVNEKTRRLDDWKDYMSQYDRHAACPSPQHALRFVEFLLSKKHSKKYTKSYLRVLANMFEYWSEHPKMPHGTGEAIGYNPFKAAQNLKRDSIRNINNATKPQHQMPVEELGHQIRNIKNILHTAVITSQFKYGLRGGQVCAVKIPEVNIHHDGLKDLYPTLGTHRRVCDFDCDVVYFPTRDEQPGVKSERPTVMPIGTETRKILIKYLRQRPPVDEPWLFVSNSNGEKLNTDKINKYMWKPAFHPKYEETDQFQSVTSHYARHRFATYWRKEVGMNPELIKYMRGDKQGELEDKPDVLDDYIHTYFDDIKNKYLSGIYQFGL